MVFSLSIEGWDFFPLLFQHLKCHLSCSCWPRFLWKSIVILILVPRSMFFSDFIQIFLFDFIFSNLNTRYARMCVCVLCFDLSYFVFPKLLGCVASCLSLILENLGYYFLKYFTRLIFSSCWITIMHMKNWHFLTFPRHSLLLFCFFYVFLWPVSFWMILLIPYLISSLPRNMLKSLFLSFFLCHHIFNF